MSQRYVSVVSSMIKAVCDRLYFYSHGTLKASLSGRTARQHGVNAHIRMPQLLWTTVLTMLSSCAGLCY
jgi:hypothetical protein